MDLIDKGIKKKLIRLEDDGKYIVYIHQGKRRNFSNPEEKVQAETYLQLVLTYGYPPDRIRLFVSVQMGSETREADIIVYSDLLHKAPLIVVECKKETVSELEFIRASEQSVTTDAQFVGFNLRNSSQLRFSRIDDFKAKLRINLEKHFKLTHE